jgi:hypothetical protein
MRTLLRFLMLRRFLDQSRRHRRSGWGYGSGYGRRPSYGWGYGRPRHRGRSQVRVTGCCLPIPLGMLMAAGGLSRLLFARLRP